MEYEVDSFEMFGNCLARKISLAEFEAGPADQPTKISLFEIAGVVSGEAVQSNNGAANLDQALSQVGADKTGHASDEAVAGQSRRPG